MSMDLDFELNADRLREECGVFGIYGHPDAAALTALGLHALQHRGQEAAGIVSFDGERFQTERHLGLVQASETSGLDRLLDGMADMVEAHLDLNAIQAAAAPLACAFLASHAPVRAR